MKLLKSLALLFAVVLLVSACSDRGEDPGAKRTGEQAKALRDRLTTTQYDR